MTRKMNEAMYAPVCESCGQGTAVANRSAAEAMARGHRRHTDHDVTVERTDSL